MSTDKVYLYVDGESHYIRSRHCWKKIHGKEAELDTVELSKSGVRLPELVLEFSKPPRIKVDHAAKLFWDAELVAQTIRQSTKQYYVPSLGVYFTSFSGAAEELHKVKAFIRDEAGFEPYVIHELSTLEKQRMNILNESGVIEKAKGVDIALAVRMLEDAQRGNYETCWLVTSDVDYLPAIEAVRRMGKKVYVFGYRQGLGKNSPLEYIPDRFFDIGEEFMRKLYTYKPKQA